jgi:hypothetical protein
MGARRRADGNNQFVVGDVDSVGLAIERSLHLEEALTHNEVGSFPNNDMAAEAGNDFANRFNE